MHRDYEKFVEAIKTKNVVRIIAKTLFVGTVIRTCVPLDYAKGIIDHYKENRFYFHDLDAKPGDPEVIVLPKDLLSLEILKKNFVPSDHASHTRDWTIPRSW